MRKRWRLLLLAVLLVALVGLVLAAWLRPDRAGPQRVVETSLEAGLVERWLRGHAWRELPFTLSPKEEMDLQTCLRLAQKVRSTVNGTVEFTAGDIRRELEGLPDFFYAEYLLGLWHDLNGKPEAGQGHYRLAQRHAPVTLVVRYAFDDGRPLAAVRMEHLAVECNRVQNGALDPHLELQFYDLVTDQDGCVQLPVYNTVYRLATASYPAGLDADYPALGFFEVRGKVGVLPMVKVRLKR